MLSTRSDLAALVESDRWMMTALRHVASLRLPDAWVAAGFLRAKVWDTLHGYQDRSPIGDVDVVFFDPDSDPELDRVIEQKLASSAPQYPWEVYNQAHMHLFNENQPYRGTVDAFSRWAETVSTVGIRLDEAGAVDIAAPHGIEDLIQMVVRLTPHPDAKPEIFRKRLREKGWRQQWPKIRVVEPD